MPVFRDHRTTINRLFEYTRTQDIRFEKVNTYQKISSFRQWRKLITRNPVLFLSTSAAGVNSLGYEFPCLLLLKCLSMGRDARRGRAFLRSEDAIIIINNCTSEIIEQCTMYYRSYF
ncbi:uncharacterized protein LOC110117134 [Athalia rosae]|uniref:uncharacterized protein LOC110117134 n=1 Tax=Athalia rosae TaxID=37344 RepID=UPI002033DF35|nr:uncharacterized protein LOC110117134 [Athalia rosae]